MVASRRKDGHLIGETLARGLLVFSLLTASFPQSANVEAADFTQQAMEHAQRVEFYQLSIDQIQGESGPFDPRLLEPIDALARAMIEAENYNRAIELLDQQLQIHRINNGLYSAAQIPVIESLLQLKSIAGDWATVNNTLQYLSWVYQRDTTLPAPEQIKGLKKIGSWHLRALGNDVREREAFHLVQLGIVEAQAAELAVQHYGDLNEELAPYIYDQALSELYMALAIILTTDTSQDLLLLTEGIRSRNTITPTINTIGGRGVSEIETLYGSRTSTVINRSFKSRMGSSLSELEKIRHLFLSSGNIEAEAMALLYLGDYTLLRQQYENRPGNFAGVRRGTSTPGPAINYYAQAISRFADAGIDEQRISSFVRCPVLLPITVFHQTLAEAEEYVCTHQSEPISYELVDYNLLSTLFPTREGEALPGEGGILQATVSFSIRTNGQISQSNIISIEPDDTPNRISVRKMIELMQFRPALIDARAVRAENVQLKIRMPAVE
jgi:tetratricopeptide (TPR) repeat protein